MQGKKEIRKSYLNRRLELTEAEILSKSLSITERLTKLSQYIESEIIYIYMDFKNEVKTEFIIEAAYSKGKKVAIPKIEEDIMSFYYIDNLNELENGYFGILEPVTGKLVTNEISSKVIVVVPGIAFCEDGYRIGYGKGFYDRFLSKHDSLIKTAVCYESQISESFRHDEFDIKMDYIITEKRVINCS